MAGDGSRGCRGVTAVPIARRNGTQKDGIINWGAFKRVFCRGGYGCTVSRKKSLTGDASRQIFVFTVRGAHLFLSIIENYCGISV